MRAPIVITALGILIVGMASVVTLTTADPSSVLVPDERGEATGEESAAAPTAPEAEADGAPGASADLVPAEQGADAEPQPQDLGELEEVEFKPPAVRVDGLELSAEDMVADAAEHPAVTEVAAMARETLTLPDDDDEPVEISVAAVDLTDVRTLVPQVTADADAVWHNLNDGDLLVDASTAERLGVELEEQLSLSDAEPRRVGVIAATGQPPIADVLVSAETGRALGLPEPNALLAAVEPSAIPSDAAAELEDSLGGRATALIDDPSRTPVGPVEETIWDQLAMCESSGDWHINTGNGYYGGLQFLPESWWWVGGEGMPHEASRQEQIYRAELLLQRQGWEAWPACSKAMGLR